MDIKQEDLIKFWTWCGFKEILKTDGTMWRFTEFKETNHWYEAPNFKKYKDLPQPDLDNIYNYAIPKLQNKGYTIRLIAYECTGFLVEIGNVLGEIIATKSAKNPTEALYNAIMKVIDNEVK